MIGSVVPKTESERRAMVVSISSALGRVGSPRNVVDGWTVGFQIRGTSGLETNSSFRDRTTVARAQGRVFTVMRDAFFRRFVRPSPMYLPSIENRSASEIPPHPPRCILAVARTPGTTASEVGRGRSCRWKYIRRFTEV